MDPDEISMSRTAYSEDDDEDETKRSQSHSSNENTVGSKTELSKSVTDSHKPNLVSIATIESPKPKPKDIVADENMARHLKSLLPLEPPDHKALKSTKYNHIKMDQHHHHHPNNN